MKSFSTYVVLGFLFVIALQSPGNAATLPYDWHSMQSSNELSAPYGLARDGLDNWYLAGVFSDTVAIGSVTLANTTASDLFLAKYDSNGHVLWAQGFAAAADTNSGLDATRIAVDAVGNVTITGLFTGTIDFGSGPLSSTVASWDIFLARFARDGSPLWSNHYPTSARDVSLRLESQDSGVILLGGDFSGSLALGGAPLEAKGNRDVFLAAFDSNGNLLWDRQFGKSGFTQGMSALTLDNVGNIIIAGSLSGSVDFGGGPLPWVSTDLYLAEFNGDGNHIASRSIHGDISGGLTRCWDIAVAPDGGVAMVGFFSGTMDFGAGSTLYSSSFDMFLAQFGPGTFHLGWAKEFFGSVPSVTFTFWPGHVAVNSRAEIMISGQYSGTINLGGSSFSSPASEATSFLALFDGNGNHLWSRGALGEGRLYGLKSDAVDNFFVAGVFQAGYGVTAPLDLGSGPMVGPPHSPSSPFLVFNSFISRITRPQPVLIAVSDLPGDQGGAVRLRVRAAKDEYWGEITGYNVWRKMPGTTVQFSTTGQPSNEEALNVLVPELSQQTFGDPQMLTAAQAAAAAFPPGQWESLGFHAAVQDSEYSFVVPTRNDSTGAGLFMDTYLVTAHNINPSVFYPSDPDSGYSVDNLPPAAPFMAQGQQLGVSWIDLTWVANTESDLAAYRVYRGIGPDFAPSAANLLGATMDPGFSDTSWNAAAGYSYKISAMDRHGNESPFAVALLSIVTGVDEVPASNRNYLSAAVPNPFNPSTRIRFELKETAAVHLNIYDTAGRLVRRLVGSTMPGGRHEVVWDGRDNADHTVTSGIYFAKLATAGFQAVTKLTLMK